MLLLGIDLGTSFIKVSVVDAATQKVVAAAEYPEKEVAIKSLQTGWAEQSPDEWWLNTKEAIKKMIASGGFAPDDIVAIGIAYQMHGLVLVDEKQQVLRDSIIWCDSRAVETGNLAFENIGKDRCISSLLNSPGNFTAAKLAWVKANEPIVYEHADKLMLPGDFISMRLTGTISTTPSALSEGVFWDFSKDELSKDVMEYFGYDDKIIPELHQVFSIHGRVLPEVANELKIKVGIPVSYKAGDQLNNAVSLNVLQPGEVAATAGTSGVIYAVTDKSLADRHSRVNAFAHVNYSARQRRMGVLLCINGTGIMNRWIKELCGAAYADMNSEASSLPDTRDDLFVFPFGNGAERIFENKIIGGHVINIDLNKHSRGCIFRAVQEGIAFAFRYGLDIMRENGIYPSVIRVGKANLFLSDFFASTFVNVVNVPVEMYDTNGSVGAALGAGIGASIYKSPGDAFAHFKPLQKITPLQEQVARYDAVYLQWKDELRKKL